MLRTRDEAATEELGESEGDLIITLSSDNILHIKVRRGDHLIYHF